MNLSKISVQITNIYSCLSSRANGSKKVNLATTLEKDLQLLVNWGKKGLAHYCLLQLTFLIHMKWNDYTESISINFFRKFLSLSYDRNTLLD